MNSKIEIEVEYEDSRWKEVENSTLVKLMNVIMGFIPDKTQGKQFLVNITFANVNIVKQLNHKYREKDKDTNVLSFQYNNWSEDLPSFVFLGDIILSYDKVCEEAESFNKNLDLYILELLIHGALHLFGFDHEEDQEAEIMEKLEEKIINEFCK